MGDGGSQRHRKRRLGALRWATVIGLAVVLSVPALAQVAPEPNPPLRRCGLRVVLLVDTSASIYIAGRENPALMRSGAKTLLEALQGTSSTVSVISFRNNAVTELAPTHLGDLSGYRRAVQAVEGIQFDLGGFGDPAGGTNWEAPLRAARQRASGADGPPELVVMLTDGNPNRYGSPVDRQPSSTSSDFDPRALDAGVVEANALRKAGTRIVAVGVGDVREASLRAVSGPDRGKDWYVGDFDAVAQSFGAVATQLCGTRILAQARVDGVPAPEWPFTLIDAGGTRTDRRTGSDGSTFFVMSTAPQAGSVTLSSRQVQDAIALAGIGCTRNHQPFAVTPSAVDSGRVVFASAATDVVACTFDYERDPRADPVNPEASASPECAKYSNEGAALTPLSTIRLYAQWRRTICEEALRFQVSQLLIAATIQHEGYNRSKLVQGRLDKWMENKFPFRNETVGVGQMLPELARRLARQHFDIYDDLSESQIRHKLVYDTPFAIRMVAAYLSELQTTYRLTDREAFISYAFSPRGIRDLRAHDFNDEAGRPRGEKYDHLSVEIIDRGEDFS